MPKLMSQKSLAAEGLQSMVQMLCQVSEDRFVRTNWMVRQAILECYKSILKMEATGKSNLVAVAFGKFLICQAAEYGEKYEQNLVLLSDVALQVAEQYKALDEQAQTEFKAAAEKLIEALSEKGQEDMIKNNDLIRKYIHSA